LAFRTGELALRRGRDVPINITTIRPATPDERDLHRWYHEIVVREAARQ
jgi:hypothetical protein